MKKDELDKEAVKSMPTTRVAEKFILAVKQSGLKNKDAQKRAARRIIEKEDFSEAGIKSEILDEKYRMREKAKNKEHIRHQEFEEHLKHTTQK